MKYALSFFIFASALVAVAFAHPGKHSSHLRREVDLDEEDPIILLAGISPEEDVFEESFFGPARSPFNGFMSSMQSMMNSLKQRIAQHIPSYSGPGSFFGFNNIPEGANTTSTTKVINGHVVTVNETTYSDGDDVQGTVVRVRIVDIKPENDPINVNPDIEGEAVDSREEETITPSNTERSIESVEDSEGNEIPKLGDDNLTA